MNNDPDDPKDEIASLLRMAGQRPPVPLEVAERVREATRDHWRREARARKLKRRLWAGAGLAAAAVLAMGLGLALLRTSPVPPAGAPAARVELVAHPAWARSATPGSSPAMSGLRPGDALPSGAEIATESEGSLAILMASGHSVRLDAGTRLRIISGSMLDLQRGALYVDSGRRSDTEGTVLGVRTPRGVVHEIGTQYEIRIREETLRIRVREGAVILESEDESHRVPAGMQVELDGKGDPVLKSIPLYGPEWGWAERIAPMIDLKGRSLRAFLEWVSRERGWALSFDHEETEDASSGILLSGSVEGLTLDEALEAVLPTCGMTFEVEGGVLTVLPAP